MKYKTIQCKNKMPSGGMCSDLPGISSTRGASPYHVNKKNSYIDGINKRLFSRIEWTSPFWKFKIGS